MFKMIEFSTSETECVAANNNETNENKNKTQVVNRELKVHICI